MGKCEHGLTSRECYVCASPKHGEQRKPEALRLAEHLKFPAHCPNEYVMRMQAAEELLRLHDENETLRQQHLEAHQNSATIFAALVEISLLTHLGGEVAEYGDVVDAVRRLKEEKAGLLEALKNLEKEFRKVYPIYYYAEPWGHETNVPLQAARAAIARAEGEKT